eukprot:UN26035
MGIFILYISIFKSRSAWNESQTLAARAIKFVAVLVPVVEKSLVIRRSNMQLACLKSLCRFAVSKCTSFKTILEGRIPQVFNLMHTGNTIPVRKSAQGFFIL